MNFGGSNGKNPNPPSAPSALRSITRPVDRNGHRYADGNAGYDMVIAKEQRIEFSPGPSGLSPATNFGGSNGKNPNPSSAPSVPNLHLYPSALRHITRPSDRNGHRYADGNAGYDMVIAKEQNPNPSQFATLSKKMVSFPSFISDKDNGTMTISTPGRFGPWGGEGGMPWDDGVYTGVKQIYIMRNEFIESIQIEYDGSGQSIWSTRHGNGGQITHRIKLDYPHEVLTCIYGYYNACAGEGPRVLRSITVVSSRGKHGPFGDEVGTYFTSATTQGKVVGFHGRSALYLDAIGVHMQHWLGDRNTATTPSKISNPRTSSNSKAIVSSSKADTTTTTSKYYISKYLF